MHKQRRSSAKHHVLYYEAILQLRNLTDPVTGFVMAFLAGRKDCEVTKVVEFKNGVDLYMTSQRVALALGKRLRERFPEGEKVISRMLHHRDHFTSKEVFRVTVLFKMPDPEEVDRIHEV
ncbi:MAG TPA: NMD3-related protein [Candidatus Nanoarchaeia archaeon]|nr:NMD3-related protein [Candidatus Nanoarchaeia archaeon]